MTRWPPHGGWTPYTGCRCCTSETTRDEWPGCGLRVVEKAIPAEYAEDAMHVAIAALNGMDFVVTWNFTHINNAATRHKIRSVIERDGYQCPEPCSPEEVFGDL